MSARRGRAFVEAEARVLGIQAKLHRWATDSGDRRFDDLFKFVADPAFLTVGWARVRGNRGARTAGMDGVKARDVLFGAATILPKLTDDLRSGGFEPLPVRERMIPKASGKLRRLGIPTARDRCVQASLQLVLEHLRETALGFRNLTNYIARCLLEAGGFRPQLHRRL